MTMRYSTFSFDDGPSYVGVTDGRTWNGWACPSFTREVAESICRSGVICDEWRYDESTECFLTRDDQTPCGEWDAWPVEIINGQRLYALGSDIYCWNDDGLRHPGDNEVSGPESPRRVDVAWNPGMVQRDRALLFIDSASSVEVSEPYDLGDDLWIEKIYDVTVLRRGDVLTGSVVGRIANQGWILSVEAGDLPRTSVLPDVEHGGGYGEALRLIFDELELSLRRRQGRGDDDITDR